MGVPWSPLLTAEHPLMCLLSVYLLSFVSVNIRAHFSSCVFLCLGNPLYIWLSDVSFENISSQHAASLFIFLTVAFIEQNLFVVFFNEVQLINFSFPALCLWFI